MLPKDAIKILKELSQLYRNNLKNRFLTASVPHQNFCLHSRLVHAQWSLAPDKNFDAPPCQIPDSSGCFGIGVRAISLFGSGAKNKASARSDVDLVTKNALHPALKKRILNEAKHVF